MEVIALYLKTFPSKFGQEKNTSQVPLLLNSLTGSGLALKEHKHVFARTQDFDIRTGCRQFKDARITLGFHKSVCIVLDQRCPKTS